MTGKGNKRDEESALRRHISNALDAARTIQTEIEEATEVPVDDSDKSIPLYLGIVRKSARSIVRKLHILGYIYWMRS